MLTEQMASSGASDEQMASSGASEHAFWNGLVPIVEVAFAHGKWWSIPEDMSRQLYEQYVGQQDACYTWDWGEGGRCGSWAPDGEETKINRYSIDFVNFVQTRSTTTASAPYALSGYVLKMCRRASQASYHHRHDQWCCRALVVLQSTRFQAEANHRAERWQ